MAFVLLDQITALYHRQTAHSARPEMNRHNEVVDDFAARRLKERAEFLRLRRNLTNRSLQLPIF